MKTKYKITGVVFGIVAIVMVAMMGGTTCILVGEGSPNDWLGSIDGCGPLLTYEIHKFFGIFWSIIPQAYAGVPFERVPISSFGVYSMDENQLNKVEVGQQIMFRSDIENVQDIKQSLVYGVQVFDQNQEQVFVDWIETTLGPKSFFSPSILWTPTVIGNYTATSTVWESMDNPTAFSAEWEIEFEVELSTEEFTGEEICGPGNVLVDGICIPSGSRAEDFRDASGEIICKGYTSGGGFLEYPECGPIDQFVIHVLVIVLPITGIISGIVAVWGKRK